MIAQILSRDGLAIEGRALRHCVSSYAYSCASGRTSIWSLQLETTKEAPTRLLTLEVAGQQKQIVQARGKNNAFPSQQQYAIVRRWASQAGLGIGSYVKPSLR